MTARSLKRLAAAALFAVMPVGALAQEPGNLTGPNGPLVIPNGSGTVIYQNSGGTTVAPGGTTVFHGTGPTTTITYGGTRVPSGNGGTGTGALGPVH
jgi:hypothetical protein